MSVQLTNCVLVLEGVQVKTDIHVSAVTRQVPPDKPGTHGLDHTVNDHDG